MDFLPVKIKQYVEANSSTEDPLLKEITQRYPSSRFKSKDAQWPFSRKTPLLFKPYAATSTNS